MSISIDDEKLSQMIRDYIEIGSTAPDSCLFPPSDQLDHKYDHKKHVCALQEIMEESPDAEDEIYSKIKLYLKDNNLLSMEKLNMLKKWIVFRLQIDKYEAHLCKTSWSAPLANPSVFQFRGEYEYVEVMMREKGGRKEMRLIVDIDFRRQFGVARATTSYQELINALPLVFVGTEEKLEKLVSLICSAAKQSLKERGLHIPPWRRASYMQSKWLSKNCKRV
ncbi:hypothetical protein ACS0TY_035876 [Phlomoides rotata]